MLVGLGGNNGTTLMGGILANKQLSFSFGGAISVPSPTSALSPDRRPLTSPQPLAPPPPP
jgi:hypothetical protein